MCVNVMTSLHYPQMMLAVPTQILQNNIPRIPSKSLQVPALVCTRRELNLQATTREH
ncbi:unnamed protein product [Brassica rapa subsp. trilocularis]